MAVASPSTNTDAIEHAGIAAQVNSSRIRRPMIDTTSNPGTTMIARVPT